MLTCIDVSNETHLNCLPLLLYIYILWDTTKLLVSILILSRLACKVLLGRISSAFSLGLIWPHSEPNNLPTPLPDAPAITVPLWLLGSELRPVLSELQPSAHLWWFFTGPQAASQASADHVQLDLGGGPLQHSVLWIVADLVSWNEFSIVFPQPKGTEELGAPLPAATASRLCSSGRKLRQPEGCVAFFRHLCPACLCSII